MGLTEAEKWPLIGQLRDFGATVVSIMFSQEVSFKKPKDQAFFCKRRRPFNSAVTFACALDLDQK